MPNNQERQLKKLKFKEDEKLLVIVVSFSTPGTEEKSNFFLNSQLGKFFSFSGYS